MPLSLSSFLPRRLPRAAPVVAAGLALAALALPGCVVAPLPFYGGDPYGAGGAGYDGYAPYGPPPPQYEVAGYAPSPSQVWIGGAWAWEGRGYGWRPGRWATPPRPGAGWVPHSWQRGQGGGWRAQGGRWR